MQFNNFSNDLKAEDLVTDWFTKNFSNKKPFLTKRDDYTHYYEKQVGEPSIEKIEKVTDASLQKKGVDLLITSKQLFGDEKEHKVDIKSAINYIKPVRDANGNRPNSLPTFAFELYFKNGYGNERDGWLYSEKYCDTEYYIVSWLWANVQPEYNPKGFVKNVEIGKLNMENIAEIEFLVIEKKRIQEHATKIGITKENFRDISKEMWKNNITKKPNHDADDYLRYSNTLMEKPVNLIIKKKKLKEVFGNTWIIQSIN